MTTPMALSVREHVSSLVQDIRAAYQTQRNAEELLPLLFANTPDVEWETQPPTLKNNGTAFFEDGNHNPALWCDITHTVDVCGTVRGTQIGFRLRVSHVCARLQNWDPNPTNNGLAYTITYEYSNKRIAVWSSPGNYNSDREFLTNATLMDFVEYINELAIIFRAAA